MPANTVQHLLREVVANPAYVVGVKRVAQVGESCPDARKLLIFLHSIFTSSGVFRHPNAFCAKCRCCCGREAEPRPCWERGELLVQLVYQPFYYLLAKSMVFQIMRRS